MRSGYRTQGRNVDRAIGITAIVIGILVLLGELTFSWLVPLLGVILVIIGILMLVDVLAGKKMLGVAFLVVGILLMVNLLGIPSVLGRAVDLVVGVALLVIGFVKLT